MLRRDNNIMGRKRNTMTPEEVERETLESLNKTGGENPTKRRKNNNEGWSNKAPTKEEQERVERWSTWSRQQHTPDEIRAEILRDHRCVCFTYLCSHCKFPMSFLEEFLVLSTCLLDETNYDKDFKDVKDLLFASMKVGDYDKNLTEIIIENRNGVQVIGINDISERLDWKAIGTYQKIDLYTAERFGRFLPWDEMTPRCGLSQLYIDANKAEYCKPRKNNTDVTDDEIKDFEANFEAELEDGLDLDFYDDFED